MRHQAGVAPRSARAAGTGTRSCCSRACGTCCACCGRPARAVLPLVGALLPAGLLSTGLLPTRRWSAGLLPTGWWSAGRRAGRGRPRRLPVTGTGLGGAVRPPARVGLLRTRWSGLLTARRRRNRPALRRMTALRRLATLLAALRRMTALLSALRRLGLRLLTGRGCLPRVRVDRRRSGRRGSARPRVRGLRVVLAGEPADQRGTLPAGIVAGALVGLRPPRFPGGALLPLSALGRRLRRTGASGRAGSGRLRRAAGAGWSRAGLPRLVRTLLVRTLRVRPRGLRPRGVLSFSGLPLAGLPLAGLVPRLRRPGPLLTACGRGPGRW
ncbi:hypothetical protein [Salinifilum ghardaiensis]